MAESYWDTYVEKWDSSARQWPGDEWGEPAFWRTQFDRLLGRAGVADWRRAVEIGPGSGKQALMTLDASHVSLRAFDVSERFLAICAERCSDHVAAGRLSLHRIDTTDPASVLTQLEDWRGTVDGLYSLDAMVHVDLQYLIVYLITAGLVLRPGGKLVMNVATATNRQGFELLLTHIRHYWRHQGNPSSKFEWLSKNMVEHLLDRLGFDFEFISDQDRRDVEFIASLERPEVAAGLERYVRW